MYFVTTSDGKLLQVPSGKLLVAPTPFTGYTGMTTGATVYIPPVAKNPSTFYLQTIGDTKSVVTLGSNGLVFSVTANDTDLWLTNSGAAFPPSLVDAPELGGAKVLQFGNNSRIELSVPVPQSYIGSTDRSFYFLVKSITGNRNIFGYGTNDYHGIYDILRWDNGSTIGVHVYQSGVVPLVAMANNDTWQVFRSRHQGSTNLITNQTDGLSATGSHGGIYTQTGTPFRLGGGVFQYYNNSGTVTIAHFEAYDYYTTDAEDAAIVARIRTLYGLPVS